MKHTSVIELSKSAFKKNLRFIRKKIGEPCKFVSVVKGNAYGHGVEQFVPMAEECKVSRFAVAHAHEAADVLAVKRSGSEIMIMGMIDKDELEWAIENDISYFVFEFSRLEASIAAAKKMGKKAKVHIELETGLNRTGFELYELSIVAEKIRDNQEYLTIEGFCTHYAGAESIANYVRIRGQIDLFKESATTLTNLGIAPKFYHTACSAAALTYPDTIMDMVRIGIAQYGFWPSPETRMYNMLSDKKEYTSDPLKRILKWKSTVMSFKNVKAGQFIGYGTSYMATKNERIAVIPVGYSHGFSRSLSNIGHVLINGKKAPVVGIVNMSMILVIATHIYGCEIGDEVVMIGKQGKHNITISSFAELSKYVNYELLTRLPHDIPRIVV